MSGNNSSSSSRRVLVKIEFLRIQTFLFAIPRLKPMLGANALLGQVIRHELPRLMDNRVHGSKLEFSETLAATYLKILWKRLLCNSAMIQQRWIIAASYPATVDIFTRCSMIPDRQSVFENLQLPASLNTCLDCDSRFLCTGLTAAIHLTSPAC